MQVLINIVGWVPVEPEDEQRFELVDAAAQQQQLAADYQVARAVAAANAAETGSQHGLQANSSGQGALETGAKWAPSGAADQMQADQTEGPQQMMRLVSHTLAIKRKKICTMHPVPVQAAPVRPTGLSSAELLRPPTQPILNSQLASPAPPPMQQQADLGAAPANRWTPPQQQQLQHLHQQQQQQPAFGPAGVVAANEQSAAIVQVSSLHFQPSMINRARQLNRAIKSSTNKSTTTATLFGPR